MASTPSSEARGSRPPSSAAANGARPAARRAVEARQQIVVFIKKRVVVILPDKDVDFGDLELGEQIWVGARDTPAGRTWNAARIPADVPPDQVDAWLLSQLTR